MIRMTKQADYGTILLTRLAHEPGRLFNATELAADTQLPAPTVSKILKILARAGILRSHRGVKGGYALARSAESINVAQIISALEGPIAITECIDDTPGECTVEAFCSLRSNWERINRAIQQALEEITLAEMARQEGPGLVNIGGGISQGGRVEEAR